GTAPPRSSGPSRVAGPSHITSRLPSPAPLKLRLPFQTYRNAAIRYRYGTNRRILPRRLSPATDSVVSAAAATKGHARGHTARRHPIFCRRTDSPHPDSRPAMAPTPASDSELRHIRVRGAREHNLKNVDVDLPRN